MSRYKSLAWEGTWIIAGQFAIVTGAIVLVRFLTAYLDPAQYGQLALGLTTAGLVNQMVMGGVVAGIGRFYSIAAEKQDLFGYLRASRNLMVYATLGVLVIGLLLMIGLWLMGYSQWLGLAAAVLVLSVLSGYNSSLSGIQNAARQRAIVAFHVGLDAWLKILLAFGVMFYWRVSCTAVVIGYAISAFLITFSQIVFLGRTIPKQQEKPLGANHQWAQQMWAYSLPFATWGAFTWMQQVSDRWALQTFTSTTAVGHYAVLFQLGFTPVALFTNMVMNFVGPILYQRSGDASDAIRNAHVHRLGWQMVYLSFIVTLLAFATTFTWHERLFRLLVAIEYREISYLLPWVVLAGGVFAAGQMLALKLMSEMKSSEMAKAKIVTAVLGILSNVAGAAIAGVNGVVGALLVFSIIYFSWMALLGRYALSEKTGTTKML